MIGIEVKLAARPKRSEARQLEWLADRMGERFAGGYVVHSGGDTYQLADSVWAIPIDGLSTPIDR